MHATEPVSQPSPPSLRPAEWRGFQGLMPHRIHDILVVSSLYDSFILAEDGQLYERILAESEELNLRNVPGITRVSSGAEALALLEAQPRFNLVVTSLHVGDMSALTLARGIRKACGKGTAVTLLAYDARELADFVARHDARELDGVFLWQGDVRILLAIVKFVEDRWNVAWDIEEAGVQAILLVEDSVRYYSSFLPVIYSEIWRHSHGLIPDGINLSQKLLRLRARPKVLLCRTWEEAWDAFARFHENVLGVISDVEFPRDGTLEPFAGVELTRRIKAEAPDVPVLLQSSRPENEALAMEAGAAFALKESPFLLHELQGFMAKNFGFGDFVFKLPDGSEVGRASDLKSLEEMLWTVPAESVGYHGERNHFSNWLKARTEFDLAHSLRPRKVEDFPTLDDLRRDLIRSIQEYRLRRGRRLVADFDRDTYDGSARFSRLGGGSLGGKARGLAFVNLLLDDAGLAERFPGVRVSVPSCVVVGTDVFDRFLDENDLREFAIECADDEELERRFLAAELPEETARDLSAFLHVARYPLAVRSSSLLEDSQYQPFAGVYATYMIPNNSPSASTRLVQLEAAVKMVWASTFTRHAKAYLAATPYRLEEEKMAVVLQRVVGTAHGGRFYPSFAGVARSHNFYPSAPMTTADGIAAVALGFGESVVDGDACIRFCPRFPRHMVQFSSVKDIQRNSQRHFFALPVAEAEGEDGALRPVTGVFDLRRYGLDVAEQDGTLAAVGSTWSPENDAVYDGITRPGVRLVSFAPILKHGVFPLPELLAALLDLSTKGTAAPVEIEFAASLSTLPDQPMEFGFLQLRPLALAREEEVLAIGEPDPAEVLCRSRTVLGNGRIEGVMDIVVVDVHRFDRSRSRAAAAEVARLNARLVAARVPYLLVGVGRWGSADPFLGIPVTWEQISGARVIVEAGFRDFKVTPSQGSHFFQNLTAASTGYFTVNPEAGDGVLDWAWLAAQPAEEELEYARHLRIGAPLRITMNGRRNEGIILKPPSP